MSVGVENIDKAVARPRHVVMLFPVLFRIGDEEIAVDILNAERRKAGRDARILEASIGGCRHVKARLAAGRGGGKHVNRPAAEVGGEEEDASDVDPDS